MNLKDSQIKYLNDRICSMALHIEKLENQIAYLEANIEVQSQHFYSEYYENQ